MGNSSMSRCAQPDEAASANASNKCSCNANDGCGKTAPGAIPGSQQNTQGWKLGDPVCPVDRASYTKRVADRILFDLDQIDKNNSVWTREEKKKVSEGVAGIACNLHENWCLYGKVIENAIGGPIGRIYNNNKTMDESPKQNTDF